MLVYGKEARLPSSLELPSLEIAHHLELIENDAMTVRLAELMEPQEVRGQAMHTIEAHQEQVKRSLDKKATNKVFKSKFCLQD